MSSQHGSRSPQTWDPREKAGEATCFVTWSQESPAVTSALPWSLEGGHSVPPTARGQRGRAVAATFGGEAVRVRGHHLPCLATLVVPGHPLHCRWCSQDQDPAAVGSPGRARVGPVSAGCGTAVHTAPWLRERPPRPRHRTQATVGHSRDRRRETGVAGALPSCPAQQNSLVLVTKPLRTAW